MDALTEITTYFYRGDFTAVIYNCGQLLGDDAYRDIRADLLFWKGMAHYRMGAIWYGAATECFVHGMRLADAGGWLRGRIMVALGMIYAYTGNWQGYRLVMADFNELLTKDPSAMPWAPHMWFNYACSLDNAERYAESEIAYETALAAAERIPGSGRILPKILHNLGGAKLYTGKYDEALDLMIRAESFPGVEEYMTADQYSRRAEYCAAIGEYEAAQAWCEKAVSVADDNTCLAAIHCTWAQALRANHKERAAGDMALKGLDYAIKGLSYPLIRRINALLQEIRCTTHR
ncbi:MAG TPA: tetratricopeptide repeat protein [Symbiobacteriaceae bacterium]|nr:tetratricopeptide repeat protein [Symbiobacteriaceae bacterium]